VLPSCGGGPVASGVRVPAIRNHAHTNDLRTPLWRSGPVTVDSSCARKNRET
jgi:hypothetical protein